MTSLLFLLACVDRSTAPGDPPPTDAGLVDPTDGPGSGEHDPVDPTDPPVDADGDATPLPADCDDADPNIHPGVPERCDAVDQDCNGAVDDGIVTDGAGCLDPGFPVDDGLVDLVTISVRTGPGENDGTDGTNPTVCLAEDFCFSLGVADWDDRAVGVVDVNTVDGLGLPTASFDRFTVSTSDGGDAWRPAGFEVSLDGVLSYCEGEPGIVIGDASSETLSWTDPAGWHVDCATVYDAQLTHGPLIGVAEPGEARIWVRTSSTTRVAVYLSDTEAGVATAAPVAIGYPAATDDFTWEAHLFGVTPGQTWYYAVDVNGVRSPVRTFTPPPAAGQAGYHTFAFGSCSKDDVQPIFESILAWDPDLFLFVGDNHYGNTSDLDALRQYYRWAHEREGRNTLLATTPILATWDDHDFVGNNTLGTAPGGEQALQAFTEYWANPSVGREDLPGVFTRASWGDVDFFLIDDRYYRLIDGETMLGREQEAWLIDALSSSTATFKVIASGSKWSSAGSSDSWAAYLSERERIEQAIVDRAIGGVVLLSGDIHRSELRRIAGLSGGYDLPELISSPLARIASGCSSPAGELLTCFDDTASFIGVEIDTLAADPTLTAEIHDIDGEVVYSWTLLRSELEPGNLP